MGVPPISYKYKFCEGIPIWDLGVLVICKTPIFKMIILHLKDVWGLFHASIESSYNLFFFKFIVRMTQIMWRRFFENKLKEKGEIFVWA